MGIRLTKAGHAQWQKQLSIERDGHMAQATKHEAYARIKDLVIHKITTSQTVLRAHMRRPPRPRHVVSTYTWLGAIAAACVMAHHLGSFAAYLLCTKTALQPPLKCSYDVVRTVLVHHVSRVHVQFGNPVYTGRAEQSVEHPNKLINKKDGLAHEWDIAESFKDKQSLADVMDEHPSTHEWGLDDLQIVNVEPYSFEVTKDKPVFRR